MEIIIRKDEVAPIATIAAVLSCTYQEKLSTVKTLTFETILEGDVEDINDTDSYTAEFNNDFYDVVKVKKALSGGMYKITVNCEHISYRLSKIEITPRTITGTPREILSNILRNTGFTLGYIEPTATRTYTIKNKTSVRAAILDLCATIGAEADFSNYFVSVQNHRGSTVVRELVERNVVAISKTVDKANGSRSYTCTVYAPTAMSLGDEVHFQFSKLRISENVRVVGIKTKPFTSKEVELEVDSYTPTIESQFNQIESSMVEKGKDYYGVSISPTAGLDITRADGKAKVVMNAEEFSMSAEGEDGQLKKRLYFDPLTGTYKFAGTIEVDGGSININDNFIVDEYGNAYLSGSSTIYGGRYYAGRPDAEEGFSQMTQDGFEVYNSDNIIKLRFGYTTDGEDYPFIQLGSGQGSYADFGLIKKFTDGLWIGNSEPEDESGTFVPKTGYNGLFFRFSDNTAFVVKDTLMKNIYTGAAIAKFG